MTPSQMQKSRYRYMFGQGIMYWLYHRRIGTSNYTPFTIAWYQGANS